MQVTDSLFQGKLIAAKRMISGLRGTGVGSKSGLIVSGLSISAITVMVNGLSFLKELTMAYKFGMNDAIDAFLMAFLIPNIITGLLASSFSAAFIPHYTQVRVNKGEKAAAELLSSTSFVVTGILLGLALILCGTIHLFLPYLASGFGGEKLMETRYLFFLIVPTIVINGMVTIWSAVLNSIERFSMTVLSSAAIPAASIVLILLCSNVWGIYAAAAGMVLGFLIQCYILLVIVIKQKISLRMRWYGRTPELRETMHMLLSLVAVSFVSSNMTLIDQAIAATLGSGSVAALNYGNKFITILVSVAVVPVGTIFLTYFSKNVAEQNWAAIRKMIKSFSKAVLLAIFPLTAVLYVTSTQIVRLLFERGSFTHENTLIVGHIQALYVLQFPFHLLCVFMVRLISALNMGRILLIMAFISVFVNTCMDLYLIRHLGVSGIALSRSVVFMVAFVVSAVVVLKSRVFKET